MKRVDRLRPRPDRTIKPLDIKPILTPNPIEETPIEAKVEPLPEPILMSEAKSESKNRTVNRLKKRKNRKELMIG
jgi:hypothetical protein